MAHQHFYSRVPSRISLFKKIDGFDTFAHSASLKKEFILGELSTVYQDKLTGEDMAKIRDGAFPTVYSQTYLQSGNTVQSALTYLPTDYTGERSSYLVHSLVLTEEERFKAFANIAASCFNPDMFITDIALFDVTAPNAAPNVNYPDRDYVPAPIIDSKRYLSRYNPEMLSGFILSVLLSICGSGKHVYFRLPFDDKRASREALHFINAIMAVLPYNFRESLSFVTFVTGPEKYPDFELKCVSSSCDTISPAYGAFFDFSNSTVTGLSHAEINANKPLTTFLYSLIDNIELRNKFHAYFFNVVQTCGIKEMSLQTLNELVFLFWQGSGDYYEATVLPNDGAVFELFEIYSRYRDALDDEYRKRVFASLKRYALAKAPIPADVFSKLWEIYPTDRPAPKFVALSVILNLIHTDAMRSGLFAFIKSNYYSEPAEYKALINEHLSRVFYGGYLQNEILSFFDANLTYEPDSTRSIILDKLLLAIRTVEIQDKIIALIGRHYKEFTKEMRVKLYVTFFEMLPECDRLSGMLVALVNANIGNEDPDFIRSVEAKICEYVNISYSNDDTRLLTLIAYNPGFCDDVLLRFIFTNHLYGKMYNDYVSVLALGALRGRAEKLISVYEALPGISLELYQKFLSDVAAALGDSVWTTMYNLIYADEMAAKRLPEGATVILRETVIHPFIVKTYFDVFKVRYGKEGLPVLKKYVKDDRRLTSNSQYVAIEEYQNLVSYAENENVDGAFKSLSRLPAEVSVRRNIAEHIRMCSINYSEQSRKATLILELCINTLKDSSFRFDAVFGQYRAYLLDKYIKQSGEVSLTNVVTKLWKKLLALLERFRDFVFVKILSEYEPVEKQDENVRLSALDAARTVIGLAVRASYASSALSDDVCSEASGFERTVMSFLEIYGKSGARHVKRAVKNAPPEVKELAKDTVKEYKLNNPGFFNLLFKKLLDLVLDLFRR